MSEELWNKSELLAKLVPGEARERGGVILKDGTIIELDNVAEDDVMFRPDYAALLPYVDDAIATWHTHPDETANLSAGDWETFTNWPKLSHLIVGIDGIRKYTVRNGAVINA